MNNTNVAMEAIQLSAEQLGDSGSSGESDDEVVLRTHTVKYVLTPFLFYLLTKKPKKFLFFLPLFLRLHQ